MNLLIKLTLSVLTLAVIANGEKLSRARQNFNCDKELNDQIQIEFDASHIYLSLASHFGHDSVALHGFKKMFEHSWKEEVGHAQKLIEYGLLRGVNINTPSINKPQNDTLWQTMTVCEIVNIALSLEMKVNQHLLKVHECGENDPQFQDFIEGEYLKEQVEANKELADLLTKLERITVTYINGKKVSTCDGLGLHMIDDEVANKFK